MPRRRLVLAAVCLVAVSCTTGEAPPAAPSSRATDTATPTAPTTEPSPTPSAPTSSPTETSTTPADVVFGTGTVTIDGTELPVSGDCDISRSFGEERVTDLGDEVDVLLAVDNITGDGATAGPFAVQVRLLGGGAVVGRTITTVGAVADDGTTAATRYEGEVEVGELRDRRELEFLDAAVLHLEAAQERVSGDVGPASRELVVDVTCPVSRPE